MEKASGTVHVLPKIIQQTMNRKLNIIETNQIWREKKCMWNITTRLYPAVGILDPQILSIHLI